MDPRAIGLLLLGFGGLALIVGLLLFFLPRSLGWLGHLPGDFQFQLGQRGRLYLPLATCLVLSLLFSLIFALITRLLR